MSNIPLKALTHKRLAITSNKNYVMNLSTKREYFISFLNVSNRTLVTEQNAYSPTKVTVLFSIQSTMRLVITV